MLDFLIIDWVTYEITVAIILIGFVLDIFAGIISFAKKGKYEIESPLPYAWSVIAKTGIVLFLLTYEGAIEYMVVGSYLVWIWSLVLGLLMLAGLFALIDNAW